MTRLIQARSDTDDYQADFDRLRSTRAATEPDWLRRLRRTGIERFAEVGFPTTREEDWKYTSVAPITSRSFARAQGRDGKLDAEDVDRWAGSLGGYRLVLVNGTWGRICRRGHCHPGCTSPECGPS
jgi:Fe-S cluster assembly protein SufD